MRIDRHSWLAMRMRREVTGVALVLLVVAALYWPDTVALGRYWLSHDFTAQTGLLIALLSGFLLFRARARFAQISIRPVIWTCIPLVTCGAASLICWRAGILTLQLFFLPLILWLALFSALGAQAARVAAFPIGFLYFALPGWGLLGPMLQRLTAWAVGVLGPVIGLPLTMSGTTAYLPGGITFSIERACSGVDFLTVGLAVAALHGELETARLRRRLSLAGWMLLLAVMSNWLRVILIIEIGYRSKMQSSLATRDHLAFGWVIFACALLLFVWLAGRQARVEPDAPMVGGPHRDTALRSGPRTTALRRGMVAAALLGIPALVYGRLLAIAPRGGAITMVLPSARTPWHGPVDFTDPLWQPRFEGAQAELRARYDGADGRAVEVIAIGFPEQRQGAQILNERSSLVGNRGLDIAGVTLIQAGAVPHGEIIVDDPQGRRSLIWSVIDIGGHLFGEPLSSQLWYGARSLFDTPYSALFALRAQCDGSCDDARRALADFLRANGPALFAAVPHSKI